MLRFFLRPNVEFAATEEGEMLKVVQCEQCESDYAYKVQRKAKGRGYANVFIDGKHGAERADIQAKINIQKKLQRAVDFVPCTNCGHYQSDMVAKFRRNYQRWMFSSGLILSCASILLAFVGSSVNTTRMYGPVIPWPLFWIAVVVLFCVGVLLPLLRAKLAKNQNPNEQPLEMRKKLGQERAFIGERLDSIKSKNP